MASCKVELGLKLLLYLLIIMLLMETFAGAEPVRTATYLAHKSNDKELHMLCCVVLWMLQMEQSNHSCANLCREPSSRQRLHGSWQRRRLRPSTNGRWLPDPGEFTSCCAALGCLLLLCITHAAKLQMQMEAA